MATTAHARLITFDNLTETMPCTEQNCDTTPVDNQYAALGVTFGGAGLYSYELSPQIVTHPNAINDFYGPGMTIYFMGNFPTAVQMYVSSFLGDSVAVITYGADGKLMGDIDTDGWRGSEENSTPYRDQQLVTFLGAPISKIDILDSSARRAAAVIDNLQFGDQLSVPLPASLGLFASAFAGLLVHSRIKD